MHNARQAVLSTGNTLGAGVFAPTWFVGLVWSGLAHSCALESVVPAVGWVGRLPVSSCLPTLCVLADFQGAHAGGMRVGVVVATCRTDFERAVCGAADALAAPFFVCGMLPPGCCGDE